MACISAGVICSSRFLTSIRSISDPRLRTAFYRTQNRQLSDFACFLQHCRGRGNNGSISRSAAGNAGALRRKGAGRMIKGEDCGQAEGGKKDQEGANSL